MKPSIIPRVFLLLIAVVTLPACAHKTQQYRAAPLPANTDEARVQQRIDELRVLNPSLTPQQARSQAISEASLADVRAEAEWREKQKAEAGKEKFLKTLDASLENPR